MRKSLLCFVAPILALTVIGGAATANAGGMKPMPVMVSNHYPLTRLHGAQ